MFASNLAFVIAAYAVTWAVILGYLLRLMRAGGRVAGAERLAAGPGAERGR